MGLRAISAILALLGAATAAAPAAAQASSSTVVHQGDSLRGHWTGTVSEPSSTEHPQYTLSVHIDADRNGRLVGEVHYEAFPCSGVWTSAGGNGAVWRFDETITNGGTRCARLVVIEISPRGGALDIRLWPVGMESQPSSGRLSRRS